MAQDRDASKTVGFLFIEPFADWEFGLLSASLGEWFGGKAISISPDGKPVRSIGGFLLTPDRSADPDANRDLDGLAVIGSDSWAASPPDVAPLLKSIAARGGVVGGICAGTLALARAGLFENAAHTSNEEAWLNQVLPDYPGRANYRQLDHATADGRIVSAPGSAPGTFAATFLEALYPEKAEAIGGMRAMFAKEYS
ncbi:glutamine amidotransferase [Escherichia coli]|nr:glutamine amidotransferase [Escherichia coli]